MSAAIVWMMQLGSTWFMTGLIWVIQVVHYPLMAQVGQTSFGAYHAAHSRLITLIVMPMMLLELGSALTLALTYTADPQRPSGAWLWLGVALLGVAWATTALASVPAHGVLSGGFDAQAHATLVQTNWLRTLAWSLRALLVSWLYLTLTRRAW